MQFMVIDILFIAAGTSYIGVERLQDYYQRSIRYLQDFTEYAARGKNILFIVVPVH